MGLVGIGTPSKRDWEGGDTEENTIIPGPVLSRLKVVPGFMICRTDDLSQERLLCTETWSS